MDNPKEGKIYAITGGSTDKCLSNGNSWKESEVNLCINCGNNLNHYKHLVVCCGQIEANIRHIFNKEGFR